MSKNNAKNAATKLRSKIKRIESHIGFCEDQINIKVYKLYGIEQPEIDIIDANAKK